MYIVLEGIVGSGKSTQVKKLVDFLRSEYLEREVISVREPGSTPIAEDIRNLAQKKEWKNEQMHPLTNAYLYAAARAQTLQTVVKPALQSGKIVVSDRSFLSSLAQQGFAQGLGIDTVLEINEQAISGVLPDTVLYLNIAADTALSRVFDEHGDKWEKMGKDFFENIIEGYEKCEKLEIMKNRFIRVDASGDEGEVFARVKEIVNNQYRKPLDFIIDELLTYKISSPKDGGYVDTTIAWIKKYDSFAFVKENLQGHITGSLLVTNPEHTKVLLMKHKKLGMWLQFGGHADGEMDILNVAIREFHEESGISLEPKVLPGIFNVHVHTIPLDKKGRPPHNHHDILYLAEIPEGTVFSHQESEVDEIRWFDIEGIENVIKEERMLSMVGKIKRLS